MARTTTSASRLPNAASATGPRATTSAAEATATAGKPPREPLGPRFAHLLASTGASNLADGILLVGVPLLALTLTRSPQLIALVPTALTLPWLLLALPVGVLVDRHDRVRMYAVAMAVRVVLLATGAVLGVTGLMSMPALLVLVFAFGVAEVFADSASGPLIPATVPKERLATANSRLMGVQQLTNAFLGGPVAGVVVALGVGWLFGVPAALCAIALVLILRGLWGKVAEPAAPSTGGVERAAGVGTGPADGGVTGEADDVTDPTDGVAHDAAPDTSTALRRLRVELAEGARYLRGHDVIRPSIIAASVLNLASAAYFAVFVLWAVGPESAIGLPPEAYGLLMAGLAAGALAGAAVSGRLAERFSEARLIGTAWVVNSAMLLVPVLVPTVWALAVTVVVLGFSNMVGNVVNSAVRQRLIPSRLLGRVGGVGRMLAYGGMPVGSALGGVVGEHLGLPAVFVGGAVASVVVSLWWARVVPQATIDAAEVG